MKCEEKNQTHEGLTHLFSNKIYSIRTNLLFPDMLELVFLILLNFNLRYQMFFGCLFSAETRVSECNTDIYHFN